MSSVENKLEVVMDSLKVTLEFAEQPVTINDKLKLIQYLEATNKLVEVCHKLLDTYELYKLYLENKND